MKRVEEIANCTSSQRKSRDGGRNSTKTLHGGGGITAQQQLAELNLGHGPRLQSIKQRKYIKNRFAHNSSLRRVKATLKEGLHENYR